MSVHGVTGLHEDLRTQRAFLEERVPVYGELLDLLDRTLEGGPLDRLRRAWGDRTFGAWYARPLLLLACLRDDALREGPTHPLYAHVVEGAPDVDPVSLQTALAPERTHFWHSLARRHMQTNETTRAVAWLWPAHIIASADPHASLALFDIGASAGLNLVADALPAPWSRADGAPFPLGPLPSIVSRTGFDLRPLDPRRPEAGRWLRACIWPGQTEREARLEAALDALRSLAGAPDEPVLHQARAADVPAHLPTDTTYEQRALAFQTIMRDYLEASERDRYEEGMRRWLRGNPPGAALWVELEVTSEAAGGGRPVAMTVHVRAPAGNLRSLVLAHCEPHPRALEVDDDAAAMLAALVQRG
ncbi:MAG: DUF2332 family protein [Myxococcota bacterium]